MKDHRTVAIVTLLGACVTAAHAQTFPSRPPRITTPFAPGATTDLLSKRAKGLAVMSKDRQRRLPEELGGFMKSAMTRSAKVLSAAGVRPE